LLTTTPGDYERLAKAEGVKALRTPSGQFLNINLGCDQKPFNDVRVRQALALAVDREATVGFVAGGYGTPGNDTPLSSAYHFYKNIPLKKPDIAKAKQLLADAGYPNGIDLTLVASDRPSTRTQLGVAVREMAAAAGFRINVQTMPHATYLDQVWKKGNFYVGFYNMQPTADAVFKLLYTSDAAWNETHWNNADFDAVVNAARVETDEAKRTALYAKAQDMMNADVPSVISAFFDLLAAQRSYVEGYALHPRGSVFRLDMVSLGAGAPKRA
jgi:peptide/nickel transport system substrate-binding protein